MLSGLQSVVLVTSLSVASVNTLVFPVTVVIINVKNAVILRLDILLNGNNELLELLLWHNKEQFCLEPVSKPLEDGVQASEMGEALEQFWVVFPSRNQSAEVMQPAKWCVRLYSGGRSV